MISIPEQHQFIRARRIQMEHLDEATNDLNRRQTMPPRSHDVERLAAVEATLEALVRDKAMSEAVARAVKR